MKDIKNTLWNASKSTDDLLSLRLETDAVLHLDDGRYALIEYKLFHWDV